MIEQLRLSLEVIFKVIAQTNPGFCHKSEPNEFLKQAICEGWGTSTIIRRAHLHTVAGSYSCASSLAAIVRASCVVVCEAANPPNRRVQQLHLRLAPTLHKGCRPSPADNRRTR